MDVVIKFIIHIWKKETRDFKGQIFHTYKTPKINNIKGVLYANQEIHCGEKILEGNALRNRRNKSQLFTGKRLILPKSKGNVQFTDENTLYAVKEISPGERLIFSMPPAWCKPILFYVPNIYLLNLISFFMVFCSLIIFILFLILLVETGLIKYLIDKIDQIKIYFLSYTKMQEIVSYLGSEVLPILVMLIAIFLTFSLVYFLGGIAQKIQEKFSQKTIEKTKREIDSSYGIDNLFKDLGRSTLPYPIICFGGSYVEPCFFSSLEEYATEYVYQGYHLSAKYLLDANGNKYEIQKIKIQLGGEKVSMRTFEKIYNLKEKKIFEERRDRIVSGVKNIDDSVYEGVVHKMANAENIQELVKIMEKGDY